MKYLRLLLNTAAVLAVCAFGLGRSTARASDVKVIANQSVAVAEISSEELKRIFLATKTSLGDSSHVEPVLEKSGWPTAFELASICRSVISASSAFPELRPI